MKINEHRVRNFRNIKQIDLRPGPGLNIITGDNAQGKTNLLESIFVLSTGTSFRSGKDVNFIKFDEQFYIINSKYCFQNKNIEAVLKYKPEVGKTFTINSRKAKISQENNLRIVLFTPDDLYLIKGSPVKRRNYLDFILRQVSAEYSKQIDDYNKILCKRNLLLRNRQADSNSFAVINEMFIDTAVRFIINRINLANILDDVCQKVFPTVNHEGDTIKIRYALSFPVFSDKINDEIHVGKPTIGEARRGYIKFFIYDDIPHNATITSIQLKVWPHNPGGSEHKLYIHNLTYDPENANGQTLWNDIADGACYYDGYALAGVEDQWVTISLYSLAVSDLQSKVTQSIYYWAIGLREIWDNDNNSQMYGFSSSSYRPKLEVTYTIPCNTPQCTSASNITETSAKLNWNSSTGANSYNVRYRVSGGSWTTVCSNTTSTYCNVTGLTCSTSYEYQVQANCSGGNTSSWSNSCSFQTSSCDIINESFLSNLISIYPNPANNTLNIEIDKDYLSKTDINIYLYDVIGKLMKEINNNDIINNIIQINLTSFADGIYYLNIQTSDGSMVKKIVIQR